MIATRAAAETYIGLVEFGAGVIPAGGGCARLYQRNLAMLLDAKDLQPAFRKTFETIGMAKVATSAAEAISPRIRRLRASLWRTCSKRSASSSRS